ncbi:MAG: hypothetical protein L0Y56_18805 [Nitrospira sp.]|nr:hypothetical protein [Nitrospira sp.]
MSKTKSLMIYVLAFCFLTLFPLRDVRGGDVVFNFSNLQAGNNVSWCVVVNGPFLRTSGLHGISSGISFTPFYTAGDGIGSQYGTWTVLTRAALSATISDAACGGVILGKQEFELKSTTTRVDIEGDVGDFGLQRTTITQHGTETALGRRVGTVFQHGTLGDDARPGRPDRDTFTFDATEGDEVTLRLVENPSTGHLGSQATLILRNAENGGPLNAEITEDVPIEMNETIPATGRYEIIVEQHDIQPEVWFRGDYFLELESTGDTEAILPGEHVEH